MNLDFNRFSSKAWVAIIFLWVTVICSGILFLFLYKNSLFTTLDISKLIFLSSSISIPIWLINCLLIVFSSEETFRENNGDVDFLLLAICSAIISIPIFYIPFFIKLFLDNSLRSGVIWILGLQLVFTLLILVSGWFDRRKKRKS